MYLRTVRAKDAEGLNSNTSVSWRTTGRTAVPNSASSPIWRAKTYLRRILSVSLRPCALGIGNHGALHDQ